MSIFNFCPLISCQKGNTEKLEKIHFRALKFIFQDFNSFYNILPEKVEQLPYTYYFKIVYGLSRPYFKDFICLKDTAYTFRFPNLLDLTRPKNTRFGTNSFRFQTAKLWNSCRKRQEKLLILTHSGHS